MMIIDQFQSLLSPSNPVFTRARQGKWIPNALVAAIVFALFIGGFRWLCHRYQVGDR